MKRRAFAAAGALAAGLFGLSTLAASAEDPGASRESALRRFQFEQMLAFHRARGDAFVPKSPYDPTPPMRFAGSRAQFERTGGNLVPTPPTHDQLLEQAMVVTFRQMLVGNVCCPCSSPASCNDGLFCNGTEVCASGTCTAGSPPCVDGDPCTIDSCTENTDTCTFPPAPPPPQVAQLDVSRSAPSSTVATLAWSAVTGASAYNIYRGASADLGDLACFQGGVTVTSQNDDGVRPARAFYYLVSSLACGESDLGTGNPSPRPPAPGCP